EVLCAEFGVGDVDAGLVPVVQLEDQRLVLQQAAPAGQRLGLGLDRFGPGRTADVRHGRGGHASPFFRARVRMAMSVGVVVSVAASKSTSSSPASGASRE